MNHSCPTIIYHTHVIYAFIQCKWNITYHDPGDLFIIEAKVPSYLVLQHVFTVFT